MCNPAIAFVLTRRKESGGFGATPRLPATIQDTYHALNILILSRKCRVIGQNESLCLTEGNLPAYLAACCRLLPATGITTIFQLLWSCRIAGVDFDQTAVEKILLSRMREDSTLEEWYACTRVLKELLDREPGEMVNEQTIASTLARPWRCVDELWMHIYLARQFRASLPLPASELIDWLQSCQNGDGGFGFFPGTTSFIENCHASLRALVSLNSGPLDPGRAALFLKGCQTSGGGFSRNCRAAPFLDATRHALAALLLLRQI